MTGKLWFVRHRDDEWWDEITMRVVPRYKTSGLSGDEWRVSVLVEAKRKGVVLASRSWNKMEYALAGIQGWLQDLSDRPMGLTWETFTKTPESEWCYQPGCDQRAVSTYVLKHTFCREGHKGDAATPVLGRYARRFCLAHLRRGDCGLEDADVNYDVLDGPGPGEHMQAPLDESPAAFGGVIHAEEA